MDNINSKEGYVKDLRKQHQANQVKIIIPKVLTTLSTATFNFLFTHYELRIGNNRFSIFGEN